MSKSICFTGHRKIPRHQLADTLQELRRTLEIAISHGFVDYYVGGAIGWDTYCAQMVLDLREEYPHIALHLVLPCSREEQTVAWTTRQKENYDRIYQAADSREFIAETYTDSCMRLRNQRLVELADCCICFCRATNGRTGTAQTIRMARKKGIPVINLSEDWTEDDTLPQRKMKGFSNL